jgi:fatty acid desaturase
VDVTETVETGHDPLRGVDLEGFYAALKGLRAEIEAALGPDDFVHLRKVERWGRIATGVGLATAWIAPNPLSAVALGLGRSSRWMVMHHVGHRGYDKVPGVPARYTSKVFARGWRRFVDWPDWMTPAAWIYEHNILHHQNTGEDRDPDLVERNAEWVRDPRVPRPVRWAIFGALALTWKPSYYAPATLEAWLTRHEARTDRPRMGFFPLYAQVLRTGYLPYAAMQFVALPAMYLPLGPLAVASAFLNSLGAELVTNLHTFLVVGPNHTGDDVYRFDDRPRSKGEFYARQVVGSVNYPTGGDFNDWLHMGLNYQIEHHLFPDAPMSQLAKVQPRVKALCARFGLPYVQEPVWKRFRRLAEVVVGDKSMRRAPRHSARPEGELSSRPEYPASPTTA